MFNSTPLARYSHILDTSALANNLDITPLTDMLDPIAQAPSPLFSSYQEPVERTLEISEHPDVPNPQLHYTIEMEASKRRRPYLLDNMGHK